ncbi:MAG: ROK family protein [Candidatus Nanoarchaeia archaeon]|nr:ROK family protein [Candidatus Nanoarchaeia archaeon]
MNYIIVDIGGTKTLFVYLKKSMKKTKIILSKKVKTPQKDFFIIKHLKQLDEFIKETNIKNFKLRYSVCGPVKNNVILSLPNLQIYDLDLRKYIEDFFSKKIDIKIENDVNCFAIGIKNLYKNQILNSSFFCLNIGTGIGGSYVNHQKLFLGNNGNFAEIGREIFNQKIREDFFSKSLDLIHKLRLEIIKKNEIQLNNFQDYLEFIKKYNLKNNDTIEKIDDYFFENFLELISSIEKLYDPKYIFIGGSLVYYLEYLLEKYKNKIEEKSVGDFYKKIKYKDFNKLKNLLENNKVNISEKLNYINYTNINYNVYGAIYLNEKKWL